jgi:hypothetical protein
MEVPMPTLRPLPAGFRLLSRVTDRGRIEVGVVVDGVEIASYDFSQSVDEMRAERAALVTPPEAGLFDDEEGEG